VEDTTTFRILSDADLRELSTLMRGDHTPGQGFRSLPWYWRINIGATGDESDNASALEARVTSEYEESRVALECIMQRTLMSGQVCELNGSTHENDICAGKRSASGYNETWPH
jgi:hypothetical protein